MSEPYIKIGPAGTIEIAIEDEAGEKSFSMSPALAVRIANELIIAATVQSASSNTRPAVGSIVGDGYSYVKSWEAHVATHGHEGFVLNVAPGVPMRFLMESEKLRSFATALLK